MRYLTVLFVVVLLSACDPYYELRYTVRNDSAQELQIRFMDRPDSVLRLNPHTVVQVEKFSGVGYAKEVFRRGDFQKWFSENSLILCKEPDSKLCRQSCDHVWNLSVKGNLGHAELILK